MIAILVHEIGHTLGIRHDPLLESEEELTSHQLAPLNTLSVMHHHPTRYLSQRRAPIHPDDIRMAMDLYRLPEGPIVDVEGWDVVDVEGRDVDIEGWNVIDIRVKTYVITPD
ncbi:hypothetical protein GGR58DRAFT_334577 [Xylaria digitata]|nr:hypothetical protein GGR58DRAFT_334577 [Xylaria digitata]